MGHVSVYKRTECKARALPKSVSCEALSRRCAPAASRVGLSPRVPRGGRSRIKNNGAAELDLMALRGINFSDPVISSENNRDVENR